MSPVSALALKLESLGVRLVVEGDELQVVAPVGVLTQDLKRELSARKHELLGLLRRGRSASGLVPVRRAQRLADVPLASTARAMWFVERVFSRAVLNLLFQFEWNGRFDEA